MGTVLQWGGTWQAVTVFRSVIHAYKGLVPINDS